MTDPTDLRPGYATNAELRAALLALNNAHAVELSLADAARMELLVERAFVAARIGRNAGTLDAALIAFDQDADYDSANFQWFRARYRRFVYVDRVVTAPEARGRGFARKLYAHLFERARAAGHECVVCEVNSDPPNPASEAFHQALGFEPVGEALLGNGKTVTYLMRIID
ncbi:hypothetical protein EDF56_1011122 [Novosphingobium sp. PhB165]|uniref:GNAT family N-acetyltransferase n=1 Tax=Novosphingobium sp. PhB165 TaxID=2485105 RepID=UPI00104307AA|nr:GNAT family N-acetyltransferase [Novosphingobium sp. PhB165]TCM22432.1 hypothetical protein EDF56_1011122 [Novosphingobium sp. PhB165]